MTFLKIVNIPNKYKDIIENTYIISATDKLCTERYLIVNSNNIKESELFIGDDYKYRISLLLNQDYTNRSKISVTVVLKDIINYTDMFRDNRYYTAVIINESLKDLKETMKEILKSEKLFRKFILE